MELTSEENNGQGVCCFTACNPVEMYYGLQQIGIKEQQAKTILDADIVDTNSQLTEKTSN